MSAEQFLYATDIEVHAYEKAYFNRSNRHSWLQGLYVYQAQSIALNNAFVSKKSDRIQYPKEPIKMDIDVLEKLPEPTISNALEKDKEFRKKMFECY